MPSPLSSHGFHECLVIVAGFDVFTEWASRFQKQHGSVREEQHRKCEFTHPGRKVVGRKATWLPSPARFPSSSTTPIHGQSWPVWFIPVPLFTLIGKDDFRMNDLTALS